MFPDTKKLILISLIPFILLINGCGKDTSDSKLEYIPADSVIYMGSQEAFPLKESMIWGHNTFPVPDSYKTLMQNEVSESDTDGVKFLNNFFAEYMKLTANPELLDSEWGIAANNRITFYTLGLAPVLRLNLSNIELFEKKIASIEAASGVIGKKETIGKAAYRRFLLADDDQAKAWLIIGQDENDVIFTIDLGVDSKRDLAIALGQEKPEMSLASSGQIGQITDKYDFSDEAFVFFINQKELINGLTSTDANRIAKMIHFFEQLSDKDSEFSRFRTPGCRKDLLAIADNWPRTILAYDKFDFKADPVNLDVLMITEINDIVLLDSLQSINGYIPDFISDDELKIFSFGLGLDLDNLSPFLTQQFFEIKKKNYQCEFLKEMQQQLAGVNPGMIAMATAMASGLKGFSMTLNQVETGGLSPQGMPEIKELDMILTLSANNIKKLLMAAQAMNPMLAKINIPEDGSAFEIPMPLIAGDEKVMAFVKDPHLAVFVGKSAHQQAEKLSQSPLISKPSFFSMQMDYGKYYAMIFDSIPASAKQTPEMQEMIAMLKNIDMFVDSSMNVTSDGLVFKTNLKVAQKNQK